MQRATALHAPTTRLDQTVANVRLGSTAPSTSQLHLPVYLVKNAAMVYPSKYSSLIEYQALIYMHQ